MHEDSKKRPVTMVNRWGWLKVLISVLTAVLILLMMPRLVEGKLLKPQCSMCRDIARHFEEGVKKTAKSNFGGGNTNWEEKSLGKYVNSETRLVEIMEYLCSGSSKECHHMKEEYEDYIENFWFKEFAKNKDADFLEWFCIDNVKACCPKNTFGKTCLPCDGGKERPCMGNGNCEGEGTRDGTGECRCFSGYTGKLCDECKEGYYEESKNETHTVCNACHISCKDTCSEGGPNGCDECGTGWQHSEEHGCQDINECSPETSPCSDSQYCTNTEGSYSCFTCDIACVGCIGAGADNCKVCSEGFTQEDKSCKDIDECSADKSLCTGNNEKCVNEPGTYRCDCVEEYRRDNDKCVPKPKEDEKIEDSDEDEEDETDEEPTSAEDVPKPNIGLPPPKMEL